MVAVCVIVGAVAFAAAIAWYMTYDEVNLRLIAVGCLTLLCIPVVLLTPAPNIVSRILFRD